MKEIKAKGGEIELQPTEYAPRGPVRLAIDAYRATLEAIAAIEPCPCPCCGDHEAVALARDALDGKGSSHG